MSPTSQFQGSQIHSDKALANFALAYENKELIADRLSPIVPVENPSDKYFARPKENQMLYVGQATIGPTSEIPEVEGAVEERFFAVKGRARKAKIALRTDAAADVPLQLRQEAVADATAQLWLEREQRIASVLTSAASFKATTNTAAISTKWDAVDGSGNSTANPLKDMEALRQNIFRAMNTKLVAYCDPAVWSALKFNTFIKDLIKGGATTAQPALVQRQLMAEALEVSEFVVGEAWAINPSGVLSRVWGAKTFGIIAVPTAPSTRAMCFAQTMRWQALGPGGIRHEQWLEPGKGTMGVEYHKIAVEDDDVVVANDAGVLFTAVIT